MYFTEPGKYLTANAFKYLIDQKKESINQRIASSRIFTFITISSF